MSHRRILLPLLAVASLLPAVSFAQTVGNATWYGGKHDGRRTSSGEIFDQEGYTAASRTIPLGTRVRVTMQETGRSVVVLVNDRMGGHSAIIDLAKGAAREIGLLGRGHGAVSIASAANEPIEVAEATEEEATEEEADEVVSDVPRGRPRRHRASRVAAVAHRSSHAPSIILARHPVQHRSIRHRA